MLHNEPAAAQCAPVQELFGRSPHAGVIVNVHCGNASLTSALRASDSYQVHGLTPDHDAIAGIRERLLEQGVYGNVAVDHFDGKKLPYIENMVNLIVAEEPGELSREEIQRVLTPGGAAYLGSGSGAEIIRKPVPPGIDEWTHCLHDPSNNAVAHDTVVGPPKRLQWLGTPRWSRHHDRMASMSAMASTGEILWTAPHAQSGYKSPEDLLVVDGLVWSAPTTSGRDTGNLTGRDPRTVEVKIEFPPNVSTYWFHHRCYIAKATDNYIMPSRTGVEFVDFRNQDWLINHWVRGGCLYGIMPANGLIYAPPHNCACYPEAKLYGLNALAAKSDWQPPIEVEDESRLTTGPAFDAPQTSRRVSPTDWPPSVRTTPAAERLPRKCPPHSAPRGQPISAGGSAA